MGKQVWGTFSVKDHCAADAFVAEVMLYDRLVIPVPPDDEEHERWQKQTWEPDRLNKILTILGERAYIVKWNKDMQDLWKTHFDAGTYVAKETGDWAFQATRSALTMGLPRNVTGIQAVTNYTSIQELEEDLGLKPATGQAPLYGGAAVAILGHQFLVPQDPERAYEDLLKEAVELSAESAFRRKRASFWRWQREFFDDKGITDQSAIRDAIEEMQDLLEDERKVTLKKKIRLSTQFAFVVGPIVLGMLAGGSDPLTPLAVGTAFLSVGQFATDKLLEDKGDEADKPVTLLRDIQKHFGWK